MQGSLAQATQTSRVFQFGIRQKLLLILMLVLLSTLTISGWLALNHEKENTIEEINQRGNDISRFVAKALAYSVVGYDYHTIQLLLDEITLSEEIGYARVTSRKGNTMAESGKFPGTEADGLVIFKQDIMLEQDTVGELLLGMTTIKSIKKLENKKNAILLREVFIVLLSAIGEFLALSFYIIRPVRVMSQSLSNSVNEKGQIVGKIPVISQDEFGHLAESFNHLSNQLNDANSRLQSKIELADHQLLETNKQLMRQSEELQRMNENFKKLSITDPLTGLYNRRQFEELMKREIASSRRHRETNSLMILDLDRFKSINDEDGHPCGDSVLKDIADILKSRIRETDYICRIGGEEFAVLCKRADKQDAIALAEELRKSVESTTLHYIDNAINVTLSIGISTCDKDNDFCDVETLYRQADNAVYYSKKNGRNCVSHINDIDEEDFSS